MPYLRPGRRRLWRRAAGAARQRPIRAIPGRPEAPPVQDATTPLRSSAGPACCSRSRPASSPTAAAARIVSAFLTMVGATAAQSIYYFPKSDLTATAIASRAVDAGAARGYGALETMTATEMMMDEIAGELGLDPIEFRLRNVLKSGMKNTQGAIPAGALRAERCWRRHAPTALDEPCGAQGGVRRRASRKILRRRFRLHTEGFRHRRGIQPREGRAIAGRPHRALSHRHRDRHRRILCQAVACVALAGQSGRRGPYGRHRLARPAGGNERRSACDEPGGPGPPGKRIRAGARPMRRPPAPATPPSISRIRRGRRRGSFPHGLWPAALAIWGTALAAARQPRWSSGPRMRAGRTDI